MSDPGPGDQVTAVTAITYLDAAGLDPAGLCVRRILLGGGDLALRAEAVVDHDLSKLLGFFRHELRNHLERPALGEDVLHVDAEPTPAPPAVVDRSDGCQIWSPTRG